MKQNHVITSYLASLLLILSSSAALATVYKWTDKDGNVHFSQTPRDADSVDEHYDVRYKKSSAAPAPSPKVDDKKASNSNKSRNQKPQSAQEKIAAKQMQQQEAAREAKNAEIKKSNCTQAQKRLVNISQGGRIYEVEEGGKRKYWDDSTRQAKIAEAQGAVDKYCGE